MCCVNEARSVCLGLAWTDDPETVLIRLGETFMGIALYLIGFTVFIGITIRVYRRARDCWGQDPYVADPARYRYRKGMETASLDTLNRVGQQRFEEVLKAQERIVQAERLNRRLSARRQDGAIRRVK